MTAWLPPLVRERLWTAELRRAFWHALGLSLLINVLLLTSPLYMLQMYDRVLTSRSEETLFAISAIALFLLASYGVLEGMRARTLVGVGLAVDDLVNDSVFTSLFRDAVLRQGGATAQPIRDLELVRAQLSGPALMAIFDLPWVPLFLVLLYVLHPVLGTVALLGTVVSVLLAFVAERVSRPLIEETGKQQIAASRFLEGCLRNVDAIWAHGMMDRVRQRWLDTYRQSVDLSASGADRVSAFSATTKAFRIAMQSAMLGVGAWLVLRDAGVSPGVMIAGSIIFGRAIAPLDQTLAASRGFLAGWLALRRIDALLGRLDVVSDPMPLPKPSGVVSVEELSLVPFGARKPVVHGVRFALEAGEVLAIVGPSASGKTSLARALVGLWPPAAGKVRLDGAELSQWSPQALGSYIGYLPQDVELLAGTVQENIARFTQADAESVLQAAQVAGCHDLVLQLAQGYDTRLGEGGTKLSAGQSQRVALARCFFGDPALVVLDEPDSNLDTDGVAALDAAIVALKSRKTTAVLITHNLRLLRHADKALLMSQGKMAYFGPPQPLLQKLAPQGV
ncbi:type I secretion system permease/ATPase [Candidatus Symbiobacter mobilis]|uniref:ABC-type transporter component n=1 Tax=Candidatus Symbiobacter mobilis CR TaxID=946483 RepID=U5N949_9BURK|nr:type I secretion system permease/ATPase [Candidatus Symbiobacter mobilis]AGX86788.1 ABC-type transporter component [Candidatus Symbiobacter mobilis CR]